MDQVLCISTRGSVFERHADVKGWGKAYLFDQGLEVDRGCLIHHDVDLQRAKMGILTRSGAGSNVVLYLSSSGGCHQIRVAWGNLPVFFLSGTVSIL